jgi:hypothetical protein
MHFDSTDRSLSRFSWLPSNHLIRKHRLPCTMTTDTLASRILSARYFRCQHPLATMHNRVILHFRIHLSPFSKRLSFLFCTGLWSTMSPVRLSIQKKSASLQIGVPITLISLSNYAQTSYSATKATTGRAGHS